MKLWPGLQQTFEYNVYNSCDRVDVIQQAPAFRKGKNIFAFVTANNNVCQSIHQLPAEAYRTSHSLKLQFISKAPSEYYVYIFRLAGAFNAHHTILQIEQKITGYIIFHPKLKIKNETGAGNYLIEWEIKGLNSFF